MLSCIGRGELSVAHFFLSGLKPYTEDCMAIAFPASDYVVENGLAE